MAGPLTRVAAFVARFDFMYPMSCLLTFCGRKVVHIEPEGGPYRGPYLYISKVGVVNNQSNLLS